MWNPSSCSLQTPDTPRPVAPPPLIFAVPLVAGYLIHVFLPWPITGHSLRLWGGAGLLAFGVGLFAAGLRELRDAETAWHAEHAASKLVTSGVFRFTRNPIYLAMAVVYAALTLLFDSYWMLLLFAPAVIVMDVGVIRREEAHLRHQFGDRFRAYARMVRRWL